TSPATTGRKRPCAATRAICAAVSFGKISSGRVPDFSWTASRFSIVAIARPVLGILGDSRAIMVAAIEALRHPPNGLPDPHRIAVALPAPPGTLHPDGTNCQ